MTKDAASSSDWPNYHATLTDGTTEIPFMFADGKGAPTIKAFKVLPYPRTALKTSEGDSKYSDLEPPYFAIAQDDFTGGRGNEDFESDTSRYFDGYHVDTNKESGVILSGKVTYSTGHRNGDYEAEEGINFHSSTTYRYFSRVFTATSSYDAVSCELLLRRVGTPSSIAAELWSHTDYHPNAQLVTSASIAPDTITTDTLSVQYKFTWAAETITKDTHYWIVVDLGSVGDASNHWEVGCDVADTGKSSIDTTSWTGYTADRGPWYKISPAADNFIGKFFEYKRGLYMVTQPDDGGNSALYINGDRGAADSNTGDKTNLEDATKAAVWTADEWIGDVVLITKGPGSEETQNWRNITDNDTTSLQVSPDWNVTHTIATEYVILGSDKWTSLVADIGHVVTDVEVAGEYIYMACGGDNNDNGVARYRYYNLSGVWTAYADTTANYQISDHLLAINHLDRGDTLYSSTSNHVLNGVSVYQGGVPTHQSTIPLYYKLSEIPTNEVWRDVKYTNVSASIGGGLGGEHTSFDVAVGHTTGNIACYNPSSPLNLRAGDAIIADVMSTEDLAASDYTFVYDDQEDLGKTWSPVKVVHADYGYSDLPEKVFLEVDFDGTPAFTDLTEAYDGNGATVEDVSFTEDDYLWVGYATPFNKIYFDLGTTVNAVECDTPTYTYSSEKTNTDLTNLADTTKTGTTPNRVPLAQDGTISWNTPEDWQLRTINSVEAYWVRIHYDDAALTASINIKSIYVTVDYLARMTPVYTDLTNAYDATPSREQVIPSWTDSDFVYIGNATKFNIITVTMDSTDNAVASVMTAAYHNGSAWTAVTIADTTITSGKTLAKNGTMTFTIPEDWEASTIDGTETYWIRLDVSVTLTPNIIIDEITVTRQSNTSTNLPAFTANQWQTIKVANGPFRSSTHPDDRVIQSLGFTAAVDKGALIFNVKNMWIAKARVDASEVSVTRLPASGRINGMEAYSGNADDPVENPWIFTEKGVYELQTQNDDQVVAIPLKELSTLQSSENGLGHTVNGTYLFFNIGEKIQRYFNRTLDDVGPDRDEGLPTGRPGIPVSMTSYPGRIYTAIDANAGTSSILTMRGTSWSEVYRAPRAAERIRSVYLQAIPGTNVDRLWFSMGSDIPYVPVSLHPYNEADFEFTHEGHLTTSWIYASMLDVEKLWKSLKVFAEVSSAYAGDGNYIKADYKKDTDTSWIEIGTFDTTPVEEIDIASTIPSGKRIKFRLRFFTDDETATPRLKAIVTEGVAFVPVKNQFAFSFALQKGLERIDIDGLHDDSRTPLEDYNTLKGWANDAQVLTLECQIPMADSKTVFIDPLSLAPLRIVPDVDEEIYVCQLTAIEV